MRVLALDGARCPSCGGDVRDRRGVDRSKTRFAVHGGERLPGLCFSCGAKTSRRARVFVRKKVPRDAEEDALNAMLAMLSLLMGLVWLLLRPRSGQVIDVRVPQCPACAKRDGAPEPQHVAWESSELTFIVDRRFRSAVRAMRAPAPDEPA